MVSATDPVPAGRNALMFVLVSSPPGHVPDGKRVTRLFCVHCTEPLMFIGTLPPPPTFIVLPAFYSVRTNPDELEGSLL